jgi:hypothetical protein
MNKFKRARAKNANIAFEQGKRCLEYKILVPITIYSKHDFTVMQHQPFSSPIMDSITKEPLIIQYDNVKINLQDLHASKQLVPTQLLLVKEAIETKITMTQGAGQAFMALF